MRCGSTGGGQEARPRLRRARSAPSPPPSGRSPAHVLPTIRLPPGSCRALSAETEQAVLAAGRRVLARRGAGLSGGENRRRRRRQDPDGAARRLHAEFVHRAGRRSGDLPAYVKRRKSLGRRRSAAQLVRMVLSRERKWAFPRVSGIITTPTLRADGSLLATPGYDPRSELIFWRDCSCRRFRRARPGSRRSRRWRRSKTLFEEFSFQQKALDSVALSGLLTALLRGSLPTAPIYLVPADTPGTGKSYLVDVIATVATGRLCPVITASPNREETEKRHRRGAAERQPDRVARQL